jgi:hypothetical protein
VSQVGLITGIVVAVALLLVGGAVFGLIFLRQRRFSSQKKMKSDNAHLGGFDTNGQGRRTVGVSGMDVNHQNEMDGGNTLFYCQSVKRLPNCVTGFMTSIPNDTSSSNGNSAQGLPTIIASRSNNHILNTPGSVLAYRDGIADTMDNNTNNFLQVTNYDNETPTLTPANSTCSTAAASCESVSSHIEVSSHKVAEVAWEASPVADGGATGASDPINEHFSTYLYHGAPLEVDSQIPSFLKHSLYLDENKEKLQFDDEEYAIVDIANDAGYSREEIIVSGSSVQSNAESGITEETRNI